MRPQAPEPIWLQLRPSRLLLAYLLLVHSAAWLALWQLQVPLAWRALGASLVGWSLFHGLRRHWRQRGGRAVRRLHWRSDGNWWVTDGEERLHVYGHVQVLLIHPGLILLRLSGDGGTRRLLLAGDSGDADSLRRLRVRLRRQRANGGSAQDDPLRGT